MSGILDLLNSDIGKSLINGVSGHTGQSKSKTSNLLTMAMPLLMQAMKRNANSSEGASGIMGALQKHDGSILDNLGGLFSGENINSVSDDGGKILGHLLGNKQSNVQNALSQKSGIDAGSVGQILKVAAPILMGVLGKQQRQSNVNSSSGIQGLLGGLIGTNASDQNQSFLESMLDTDGDGSVIDDVTGMVLGGNKSKSGLGSLLGGLFGKK
ncbi:MAG: DUF937 domain-containing protein [Flavobacteriaceae bacterium]|jgi:hypothetical protein|nr:DUF937 domain-containing protein [Flavobacteriaceae bacterium]